MCCKWDEVALQQEQRPANVGLLGQMKHSKRVQALLLGGDRTM